MKTKEKARTVSRIVRRATPNDVLPITALAASYLERAHTGKLRIDFSSLALHAREMISRPDCFVAVHDNEGDVDGAIAVMSQHGLWYAKQTAVILLWIAKTPGTGRAMLRNAMEWADSRPTIRAVGLSMDFGDDIAATQICKRFGILPTGHLFVRYF